MASNSRTLLRRAKVNVPYSYHLEVEKGILDDTTALASQVSICSPEIH